MCLENHEYGPEIMLVGILCKEAGKMIQNVSCSSKEPNRRISREREIIGSMNEYFEFCFEKPAHSVVEEDRLKIFMGWIGSYRSKGWFPSWSMPKSRTASPTGICPQNFSQGLQQTEWGPVTTVFYFSKKSKRCNTGF